jgi:small subunit ribosomal protein S16
MAVAIRLRREGARNHPFYRIAVADQRSPRDGKFIELIGHYDPKQAGDNHKIDLARAEYWLSVGARASQTVMSFINKARKASQASGAAA